MAATESSMNLIFGANNIQKWADVDNDEDAIKIAARIAWALTQATTRVDAMLSTGRYTSYLDDPLVEDLVARLAGVLLYDSRGITDAEDDENPVSKHQAYVDTTLRRIQSGTLKLSTATLAYTNTPGVVNFD